MAARPMPIYTLEINAFEAGLMMAVIDGEADHVKFALSNLRNQLIALKRDLEKEAGVTKKLLPNGMLEITDKDGNKILRPPYSWEIGGN